MNPHREYARDTHAEGQFNPHMPWFDRVSPLYRKIPNLSVVLDVGCNTGGLGALVMIGKVCSFMGVDLSRRLLPIAKGKGYWAVIQAAGESLPIKSWFFDVVVLSELLEHADDPAACVAEARRVLLPGGLVMGDVPTWYGKWGYRSLRRHKWHRRAFHKSGLRQLLAREFVDVKIDSVPRRPTRHFLLPQWYTFVAQKAI